MSEVPLTRDIFHAMDHVDHAWLAFVGYWDLAATVPKSAKGQKGA